MRTSWARTTSIIAALACVAAPSAALAGGKHEDHKGKKEAGGRMTGGGNSVNGVYRGETVKVTHGFTLRCRTDDKPQRLQVNWSGGNKFHLVDLTFSQCFDTALDEEQPRAGFDTYVGKGFGRDGAYAEWKFTDAGEPGRNDGFQIRIWEDGTPNGPADLVVNDTLETGGNHQAHRLTGRAAR
jgi:hypothetical protein